MEAQHEEQQAAEASRLDALEQKQDAMAQQVQDIGAAVAAQGEATMDSLRQLTQSFATGMAAHDEKINLALAQAQAPAAQQAAPAPPSEVMQPVPEGTVRFFSPIKSLRLVVERGGNIVAPSGQVVSLPFSKIDFINGIFETSDQALIDYMRELKDPDTHLPLLGHDYFEDPRAIPAGRLAEMAGPKVVDGPRGTATMRPEKPADLAVRA